MKWITIYEADDGTVNFCSKEDDLEWSWHNPDGEKGTEIIPLSEAEEYFRESGREDIADLIANRQTYVYGHIGEF